MNAYSKNLNEARRILGGWERVGRVCNVTGKAIRKWAAAGRPPRTEYSGETNYAELISTAVNGAIPKSGLLPDVNSRHANSPNCVD